MIYSVWSWDKAAYDYFEVDGPSGLGLKPKPRRTGTPQLGGQQIETVLPLLPSNARYVGSGDVAKGRVASTLATTSAWPWLFSGALAAVAWFGYRFWKRQ